MKIIFLIAAILILSLASSKLIEIKRQSRDVVNEDLALEIEFHGNCKEFNTAIKQSVRVNRHRGCLPILTNVIDNPDFDDLNTHYFCTNKDNRRSIVHFVEIFEGTDDSVKYTNFVVSLISTAPFRVLTPRTHLARRPDCHTTPDYCNSTNYIVDSCRNNDIKTERVRDRKYVLNHDRIYITANSNISVDCKTSLTECCAYISHQSFGGICDHQAPQDLNKYEHHGHHGHHGHHDNDHHDNDHGHGGHGHGDNDHGHGGHGHGDHDNDHHDNDHHDNDHGHGGHGHGDHDNDHGHGGHGHGDHDNDHHGHGGHGHGDHDDDNDHGHGGHGHGDNDDDDDDNDHGHGHGGHGHGHGGYPDKKQENKKEENKKEEEKKDEEKKDDDDKKKK